MGPALETVVKQLEDSGIVAPGKLEEFVPPKAHPKTVEELVAELVKQHHLTRFQAIQVSQGKARALILGSYTLLDRIGTGGMGQVFKAEHRRMKRVVAIKTLPAKAMRDATAVARFQREVEAAARLRHPNIVAADDADEAGGIHFLVMEFVDGHDLLALVKQCGPPPLEKVADYILQAAHGLEYAHAQGVIHRDIKPANLLLDRKGTIKILDMGLARIESAAEAQAQAELTGTGTVMGTVDFMAPEQAISTKNADSRADIYSLGCTLFFLLTGQPAFAGESVTAKLIAHQTEPPPELQQHCHAVPDQLEAIFQQMVAKKVDDRYQTMSEVVADLELLLDTLPEPQAVWPTGLDPDSGNTQTFGDERTPAVPRPKVRRSKFKTQTRPAGSGHFRKFVYAGLGAGCFGAAIAAGVMLPLEPKDGTLVVAVDQPDAKVQVLSAQGNIEISETGGEGEITMLVDPGQHRLKVQKDGFADFNQDFTMDSGGRKAINAALLPLAQPATKAAGT